MGKKDQVSKPAKRYTFTSFRDRIEAIKIEPSKRLTTRAFDEAETSHFLSTLEGWTGFNRSKVFTEFTQNVENISQSLPQLLHYKSRIFDELFTAISKQDPLSLQPLLELIAQFCHDLGPDFLEFYEKTVVLITDISAGENTSDTLEWQFNCLAFIFKYLSKTLAQDIIPTFELLLPLFNAKEHIARFSAEALSFLLRKTSYDTLVSFTTFAFGKAGPENYNRALVLLFSEAMMSTQGSIHSKSHIIIKSLLESLKNDDVTSILCDILLVIINYGTEESVKEIYELVITKIGQKATQNCNYTNHYIKILTVLIFADTGKKVPDWGTITDSISYLIKNVKLDEIDVETKHLMTYLLSVFMRNCEIQTLTKFHHTLLHYSLGLGSLFLPFISITIEITRERAMKYTRPFVQEFINTQWEQNGPCIAYFIQELTRKNQITTSDDPTKMRLLISSPFTSEVTEHLKEATIATSDDLYEVYWRLLILSHSNNLNEDALLHLLEGLSALESKSGLKHLLLAHVVSLIATTNIPNRGEIIYGSFNMLCKNEKFLSSTTSYIREQKGEKPENPGELITILSDNLFSPDHNVRHETLQLISALSLSTDDSTYTISNQCDIIEQIPLTHEHGRDVGLRMRNFAAQFKSMDTSTGNSSQVFFKFLFGMLTVHFSPTWKSVYEALTSTFHKDKQLVWELAYAFTTGVHEKNDASFIDGFIEEMDQDVVAWDIMDPRLGGVITAASLTVERFINQKHSLLDSAEKAGVPDPLPEFMRSHAIEALKSIPEIAEAHSQEVVSLVLDVKDTRIPDQSRGFSRKERSALIELLTAFKKLKRVPRADQLYSTLLSLLSNKATDIRRIALNCLFNFKNSHVTKYKDNLINLLDDALFRDEIQKITSKGEDKVLEAEDEAEVMPLILRIIFGRAQTTSSSGSKKGMKFGAISVLPNLPEQYISGFLSIVSEKVYVTDTESDETWAPELPLPEDINADVLRRDLGYCNMLAELIATLGEKFKDLLIPTIRPLLFALLTAEFIIENKFDDHQLLSAARNVRQSGMRDLYMLFNTLDEFNWDHYMVIIYDGILASRFVKFEDENLQQPSALLKILVCWSERKSYVDLLMINEQEPALKVLSLLSNKLTKNEVISAVLDFCSNIIIKSSKKSKYQKLVGLVAERVFESLESILSRVTDQTINSKAINLLLSLVENGQVADQSRRNRLVLLATHLLEKPNAQMSKDLKLQVLKILKALIQEFEGNFENIAHLYEVAAKFLRFFTDRQQREVLIGLFVDIGAKFEDYSRVGKYLDDLNSFSKRGIAEFDYDRRLEAFREINESTYRELSSLEWIPILNTSIFFLNDVDDLAIRTNASYTIKKFIDSFSTKEEADKSMIYIFKDLILSNLRIGLRHKMSTVQTEYISILAHIVVNVNYVDDFKDLNVLLFNNEEEANFFININHIQLHRRQRAIKRLGQVASQISGANISHYILPMIEHYAYVTDESLRNIANETVLTIEELIRCITYEQYLAIFRRYMSGLKEGSSTLRDSVSLVVTISKALMKNVKAEGEPLMEGLPKDQDLLDSQLEKDMIQPISTILNKRDDDTSIHRTPLIESLACLILCLSHERIVITLPAVLTKICQILRTRHDELRDAVRKHIGRASRILGARYIRFIIKELKTALARGFQVHVLGFTVHSIVSEMQFAHGELDDSASLIMDILMENIFGSTGQEKEADGYRTSMKEVKNNKSYDLAELLCRVVSLNHFNDVVNPLKMLLQERITLRVQNKLDELLRRISLGIYKNDDATKKDMLVLCYELFKESERDITRERKPKTQTETEKHFLVQLNAKVQRVETENSNYVDTFQKFSLELLRSTLNKNRDFISADNLVGFIPLIEVSLESENESVSMAVLKLLGMMINIIFDVDGDIFKRAARRCLNIIKNFPSTESELCQAAFKYLSIVIRHRDDLSLKDTSLGYLLVRIQPDLNEQNRQGLAFNFLKALVSKHVMIPEVYDTMDKIREVMVTSHSKERRDMSRSIYFQFLMEYDQGRGRLEKQFKFLVDNLSYPAETGKQSVMELLHLVIQKSGPELLEAVSSSFFVALSKVLISETSTKSREMAIALITGIFEKKGTESFEKFIRGWMNSKNSALLKCSLQLYRIKVKVSGIDDQSDLDEDVLSNIKEILKSSRSDSEVEVKWELVYTALTCLAVVVEKKISVVDEELKRDIVASLLFPHSWIRLASSRLVGAIISTRRDVFTDADLQNIGYRLFHQLAAPSVDEQLGSQVTKSLIALLMYWEKNSVVFDESLRTNAEEEDNGADNDEERSERVMSDWAVTRASAIVRSERTSIESKKSGIQFLAMSTQILSKERVGSIAEDLILPLFVLNESDFDDDEKIELQKLALECLKLIEQKIGVSNYTSHYSKVGQFVSRRRQDRRTHRARLNITAPDAAARRRVKKHERTREKRRHEKDDSGYYHTKKKTHRR